MTKPPIRVFEDVDSLAKAAAKAFVDEAVRAVDTRGRFSVLLSGGSTPRGMFKLLADQFAHAVPWNRCFLFWGDERFVPFDDAASNFGAARKHLTSHVSVTDENLFPVPVDLPTPEDAAAAYGITLRAFFNGEHPEFDLTILGLGTDGHTASLFPETAAVEEREELVVVGHAPDSPHTRVTVTLPVINSSRRIVFLVAGESKREALRAVLRGARPRLPAALVDAPGRVQWLVERSAYPDGKPKTL